MERIKMYKKIPKKLKLLYYFSINLKNSNLVFNKFNKNNLFK